MQDPTLALSADEAAVEQPVLPPPPTQPPPLPQPPALLPWTRWLHEGLRASLLLAPRVQGQQPTPRQVLGLVLLASLLMLGLQRFEVPGPADFYVRGWLVTWWSTAALLFVVWWAVRPDAVAAWFVLFVVASLPADLLAQALSIARAHEVLPAAIAGAGWLAWAIYAVFWVWLLAVAVRLAAHFGASRMRRLVLVLSLFGLGSVTQWMLPDRAWYPDTSEVAVDEPAQLKLSQQVFEEQQALWTRTLAALAPQRPGVADVYGLVFAPYAEEDVFLRESTMVAQVLRERFDAEGRVLHLVNHASTAQTHPWATPLNLERAIAALAERMDREQDVLVVYLTSHGASNFKLSASHGPLDVEPLTPGALRAALDQAGIRHRVVAVSACFSGGWLGPLAGDDTLVMTAADATHTSYGCGRKSELTFFGRAVFDEQLRKTFSFEEAFAAAVPVIRRREDEAGKQDGFSNPQISVGEGIRPLLARLQERLATTAR